jgi:hypothetical protein
MILRVETLHSQFVHPNPKRYAMWKDALECEGLLTDEAVKYSTERGWMRPAIPVVSRTPRPSAISPSSTAGRSSSATGGQEG